MNSNKLVLKSIYEILNYDFFIPSYQRGYRWDSQQVIDLLNDIYEFSQSKNKSFYCLQPIVVLPEKIDDKIRYRVVDGQQRLTTIYIILKYLEEARRIIFSNVELFSLKYETRTNSETFLKTISETVNKTNPDFYYMSKAYKIIKEWFENNEINKADFLNVLLKYKRNEKNQDIAKNVRFIWYELNEKDDEIEVFTRLNIGKIPLTNSELIKAILLQGLVEHEKFELISQWDYIEKNLQNDRFFSFLTKESYKNTRIDFIFNLISKKYNKQFSLEFRETDNRFSFYVFSHLIKENLKNKQDLWNEVKEYFRIFEELFNNNIYYHYVGFLTNSKKATISNIVNNFKKEAKDSFKSKLEEKMQIKLKRPLKELGYLSDSKDIENLLFLFNVLITMESGYSRYPFNIHNKENWSLEHIHAQNSEELKESDKKKLLETQKNSTYIDDKIKNKIEELLKTDKFDNNKFIEIQKEIYSQFTDEKDKIHTIDNLALLSKDDNSSLQNVIFPEKRAKIKELDKQGKFIPLGTKNVFMKYYSDKVDEFLTWNKSDREDYFKVLEEKLNPFIKAEQ